MSLLFNQLVCQLQIFVFIVDFEDKHRLLPCYSVDIPYQPNRLDTQYQLRRKSSQATGTVLCKHILLLWRTLRQPSWHADYRRKNS